MKYICKQCEKQCQIEITSIDARKRKEHAGAALRCQNRCAMLWIDLEEVQDGQ